MEQGTARDGLGTAGRKPSEPSAAKVLNGGFGRAWEPQQRKRDRCRFPLATKPYRNGPTRRGTPKKEQDRPSRAERQRLKERPKGASLRQAPLGSLFIVHGGTGTWKKRTRNWACIIYPRQGVEGRGNGMSRQLGGHSRGDGCQVRSEPAARQGHQAGRARSRNRTGTWCSRMTA